MQRPSKRKGACSNAPIPKLNLLRTTAVPARLQPCWLAMRSEIHVLRALQSPLGFLFWLLEQRIARIADEIERVQS